MEQTAPWEISSLYETSLKWSAFSLVTYFPIYSFPQQQLNKYVPAAFVMYELMPVTDFHVQSVLSFLSVHMHGTRLHWDKITFQIMFSY